MLNLDGFHNIKNADCCSAVKKEKSGLSGILSGNSENHPEKTQTASLGGPENCNQEKGE